MTCQDLTPLSTLSKKVLPATGSVGDVAACLPFNIYGDSNSDLYSSDFLSGASDQVSYVYRMLGGDVLDVEISACDVYACYEEAVLEYSYLMNIHQAKNVLSDMLGSTTGSFDQDGNINNSFSSSHIELTFPKFNFYYSRMIGDIVSQEVGIGGIDNEYSASFDIVPGVQDYDLQHIISSSSESDNLLRYYKKIGNNKIRVTKVYYKTPHAMWRFFGYYGGFNVVGNLSQYGQFADSTTFEVVPVWQNRLQALAYEDAIFVRNSHYSYEIKNNHLRIFPIPYQNSYITKMWFNFRVPTDPWNDDNDNNIKSSSLGVNNLGTLPFANIPFQNINSIGKQWIRRFALACSKKILSHVRGKFSTIPIPGESVTLNADTLASQAIDEMKNLRDEFKEILDQLTYTKLLEQDALKIENASKVQEKIPNLIYVG